MFKIFYLSAFVLIIQGCSTGYRCDLGYDCVDAVEAFEMAKDDGGNDESVFIEPDEYPEFSGEAEESSNNGDSDVIIKQLGMGQVASKPVYIPDSPMRIWVAPEEYTSNDNEPIYLVDGYNLFGMIKGGWLLGNKVTPTRSSESGRYGLISPLDEKRDLGFKPTLDDSNSASPVRQLFR